MNSLNRIAKKSPLLLTCLAALGVGITSILTGIATNKATKIVEQDREHASMNNETYTKKDIVNSCWKCYIPATISGGLTIVCIFGANALKNSQQIALASAYNLLSTSYKEYQDKVKDIYGEEVHNNIMESIVADKMDIQAQDLFGSSTLNIRDAEYTEKRRTFYDKFSDRFFESTLSDVIQSEYHLNRNYCLMGDVTVNNFYDFLGIPRIEGGDELGWNICSGLEWIDFNHNLINENNKEIVVIETVFPSESTEYH